MSTESKNTDESDDTDPEDEYADFVPLRTGKMRTLKTQLKYLLHHKSNTMDRANNIHERILDAVFRTNLLVEQSYQFIRAHILMCCENSDWDIPKITHSYVKKVFSIIAKGSVRNKKSKDELRQDDLKKIKDQVLKFYKIFEATVPNNHEISIKNLSQILNYEATTMVTMYENNMKMHFPKYIKRLISAIFGLKQGSHIVRKIFNNLIGGKGSNIPFSVNKTVHRRWILNNLNKFPIDSKITDIKKIIKKLLSAQLVETNYMPIIAQYTYSVIHGLKARKIKMPNWYTQWCDENREKIADMTEEKIAEKLIVDKKDEIIDEKFTTYQTKLVKDIKILINSPELISMYDSPEHYLRWLEKNRPLLLPPIKDGFYKDLEKNPQNFIPYAVYINKILEDRGVKCYQPLCLRTSFIPGHITIDTSIINDLLFTDDIMADFRKNNTNFSTKNSINNNVKEAKKFVWKTAFPGLFLGKKRNMLGSRWKRTSRRKTRARSKKICDYAFNDMILTDGVSACVIQIDRRMYGRTGWGEKDIYDKLERKRKFENKPEFPSLSDLTDDELEQLRTEKHVACDPGINQILYMTDRNEQLRYTSMQRKVESRAKANKKKRENIKNKLSDEMKEMIHAENNSLLETRKKSCYLETFFGYVIERDNSEEMRAYYSQRIFRKLKYNSYVGKITSEARFVEQIKKKYNGVRTLLYGNWSRSTQMKYTSPVPGKGFRKMLSRHFNIVLVDEYLTSKRCNTCTSYTGKFKHVLHPRKFKVDETGKRKTKLLHGLLRCENKNCRKIWNRDLNGALNILEVAERYIMTRIRPRPYRRN